MEASQIMRILKISILFLSFGCFVSSMPSKATTRPINFASTIAFLKAGEVWMADQDARSKTPLKTACSFLVTVQPLIAVSGGEDPTHLQSAGNSSPDQIVEK